MHSIVGLRDLHVCHITYLPNLHRRQTEHKIYSNYVGVDARYDDESMDYKNKNRREQSEKEGAKSIQETENGFIILAAILFALERLRNIQERENIKWNIIRMRDEMKMTRKKRYPVEKRMDSWIVHNNQAIKRRKRERPTLSPSPFSVCYSCSLAPSLAHRLN